MKLLSRLDGRISFVTSECQYVALTPKELVKLFVDIGELLGFERDDLVDLLEEVQQGDAY